MDTAQTQPPRPDGNFNAIPNDGLTASQVSEAVSHNIPKDNAYEVSSDDTIIKQNSQTPCKEEQVIKEPDFSPQIPKIIIHSPEGKVDVYDSDVGGGDTPSLVDSNRVARSRSRSRTDESATDSDDQSKNSSHYLTPPSCSTAARSSLNLVASPDSDSSVTNDEDIQVICRYSSTPVNSCVGKTLNDTDCSMSTVDDASPISQAEISKANVSSNRCAVVTDEPDKSKVPAKESVEQDVMFLQQQMFPTRPNQDANQPESLETKPPFGVYGRDQDYSLPYQQDFTNHSLGMYQGLCNEYPAYMHSQSGYPEYYMGGQRSWTDVRGRFDRPYVSYPVQNDPCCFSNTDGGGGGGGSGGGGERLCFVYPSIYVSSAGLISVLLRNDMSVEMTVDRTIRVVSHNHMMAVATDSKGTAACLYHPAVKVFQMGYATDMAMNSFRARMDSGDAILFTNGVNYFRLQDSELQPIAPVKFSDINRDQSVNLLFSSEGYGESLVATCMQVASQAEYANLPKGGVIVRINGVKVTQSGCGDVTVVTGAKFIRLSPHNGTTRLGNRFLDIEVERDWSVKLTRGSHSFVSTKKQVTVCNGKMEAGFDENNVLKVVNLQARYPLLTEPSIVRRPGRKIVRSVQSSQSACSTPRRRFPIPGPPWGGTNSC